MSNVFKGFDVYKVDSEEPIASFKHADDTSLASASPVPVLFVHAGHALVGGSMTGKVGLWDLRMGMMHSLSLNSELYRHPACHPTLTT